jgi:hypothetical protein
VSPVGMRSTVPQMNSRPCAWAAVFRSEASAQHEPTRKRRRFTLPPSSPRQEQSQRERMISLMEGSRKHFLSPHPGQRTARTAGLELDYDGRRSNHSPEAAVRPSPRQWWRCCSSASTFSSRACGGGRRDELVMKVMRAAFCAAVRAGARARQLDRRALCRRTRLDLRRQGADPHLHRQGRRLDRAVEDPGRRLPRRAHREDHLCW